MITLNNKKFAENEKEMTESLFTRRETCVGYAKRYRRHIFLEDIQHNRIGVINQEFVFGSATKTENGYWYSYTTPSIIGKYNSYMQEQNELRALAVGHDSIGAIFKFNKDI